MAAAPVYFIMLVPLLISSVCCAHDIDAVLQRVIEAIEKLIYYYKTNYQHMNLDGIFGLKILEGQLELLLSEHKQGRHAHLSKDVVQRLQTIMENCGQVGKLAMETVQADDEQYFNNFALVITKPWNTLKPHRRVVPEKRWEIPVYKLASSVKLSEEISDGCMLEFMVSHPNSETHCAISQKCTGIMTKRGLTDYGITHQILWTALAEKAGCKKELELMLQQVGFKNASEMQLEYCTNNYYEMLAVIHVYMKGQIQHDYQDLFLEQQFVCPSLGFFEFLKMDYLEHILKWQMPSGCFGEMKNSRPQSVGHVPPVLDLKKLMEPEERKVMENINNLDLKQQQMRQQVSAMKFDSQLLKSLKVNFDHQLPHREDAQDQSKLQVVGVKNSLKGQNILNHQMTQLPVTNIHKNDFLHVNDNRITNATENHKPVRLLAQHDLEQIKDKEQHLPPMFNHRDNGQKILAYVADPGIQRKLLAEKQMPDGCLSHKTGVACGALMMYLRYLVDPGPLDLFSAHVFFPDSLRGLLGVEKYKARLGEDHPPAIHSQALMHAPESYDYGGGGADKNEENQADDNRDYDDNDEMYHDAGGGEKQKEEKRVVHFGANINPPHNKEDKNEYDVANEDDNNEYMDDDQEEDEEVPDYIKHVQDSDNLVARGDDEEGQHDDDTEYTYYDDNDNTEKGIIKKRKPMPPPQQGVRIHAHHRRKPISVALTNSESDTNSAPTKTVVLLLSASSFVLLIFMFRFIKKRRIHIRYHTRGFFKL